MNQSRRPQFREGARLAESQLVELLASARYFENGPFSWVTVTARLVEQPGVPTLGRPHTTWHDLPITIEIAGRDLRHSTAADVANAMVRELLVALVAAGKRYGRPLEPLVVALAGSGRDVGKEVGDDPVAADELHVRLPLSDQAFGEPAELATLHALADTIDGALAVAGAGRVDGTEVGGGEFLIFCVDGAPAEMLKVVRRVVEDSPFAGRASALIVRDTEEVAVALQ